MAAPPKSSAGSTTTRPSLTSSFTTRSPAASGCSNTWPGCASTSPPRATPTPSSACWPNTVRTIHRQRRKLDLPAYRLRSARESDFDELLTEDFMLFEDGRLQVVYLNLAGDAESAPIYAEMERA